MTARIVLRDPRGWNPWVNQPPLDFGEHDVCISMNTMLRDPRSDIHVLWLTEPPERIPETARRALRHGTRFHRIYTFDQQILDKYPARAENLDLAGYRIEPPFPTYPKADQVAFVTSSLDVLPGHRLRQRIYAALGDMGRRCGADGALDILRHRSPPFHLPRNDFFRAKFHIAVENSVAANYFTERLIDCFLSRTVPIYWGAPNVGDWFNPEGIITFQDLDGLRDILASLTPDAYARRMSAVLDNERRATSRYVGGKNIPQRLEESIRKSIVAVPVQPVRTTNAARTRVFLLRLACREAVTKYRWRRHKARARAARRRDGI